VYKVNGESYIMDVQPDIFENIPSKREYKETTTIKFKNDLLDFFDTDEFKDKKILECGTNHGHTTRVLSFLFDKVTTMDWREEPNLRMARELNHDRDNITYIQKNLYGGEWGLSEKFDVFFIDCVHDFRHVYSDIINCCNLSNKESYFIFDDYGIGGYYQEGGVKAAVDKFSEEHKGFNIIKEIGISEGEVRSVGKPLLASEGVIAKYDNEWYYE